MPKFEFNNNSRPTSKSVKPIIRSQNSSCAAVFYRYDDPSIAKIVNLDAANDQSIAGRALAATPEALKTDRVMIVRQDIASCTVTNDKSGISGSFTIVIKRGKELRSGKNTSKDVNYASAINTGDWVAIYMKKSSQLSDGDLASNDPKSGLKFIGIVENVRMVEQESPNGAPTLQFIVTGRSFGKVFDVNVFFNPLLSKAVETVLGVGLVSDSSKIAGPKSSTLSPDEMVKRATQFFMQGEGVAKSLANEQWYVPKDLVNLFKGKLKNKPKGNSVFDLLDIKSRVGLHKCQRGTFNGVGRLKGENIFLSLPSTGTIWSILQYVSNQATNELYTELIPVGNKLQLGLVHRQLPFSNRTTHATNPFRAGSSKSSVSDSDKTHFVDLPQLKIKSTDILTKNVGKSDHERINFIIATPRITQKDYATLFMTATNPPSVQRYGLKTFQTQTPYVLGSSQDTIRNMIKFTVDLLADCFFLAHNLYNGSIVIDGVDSFVGVGDNVYISDVQQLYHIEGYTHTYTVSSSGATSYTTELRVTRGQQYNGKVATFIAADDSRDPTTVVTSFVPTRNQDPNKGGR